MSHASGITASPELVEEFSKAKEGKEIRFLKAQIEDKQIVITERGNVSGDEKSDFEAMTKILDEDAPSYILFRIDEGPKPGWLLALYVPENSKVRMKMLYASSRDSLKRDLGSSSFVAEMHATDLDEMSYASYQKSTVVSETERLSLMSPSERMRAKASANTHIHTGVSKSYVHAVKFPMSEDAKAALVAFKSSENKAVFLQVEQSKETIELEHVMQEVTGPW
ncbi:hypothetical protein GUITHDRAFT_64841 [Guillardia theta CCMP2712]|uniref:ADF-H domain-containing protein n=1 Tax=Guillardia theta (strain CCMP2712) TaxID=905079 RepID=L1JYA9_GUITC|nr:hypothetical protein GUITHDRAFT_64841 [Guillardia theta CCMP2712]EKX53088.1 hypothetical protein GUITHDRAFT_64841 [Guillardia theta CCMP2712]|eukprot:XP_005840068.1 hypothetical protein GUITHDRAFT_64841 [Guillardia theta CCMP2712]